MPRYWIQSAIAKKGSLRKTLGISKKTGTIPVSRIKKVVKKGGLTGKRARLALTLRHFH